MRRQAVCLFGRHDMVWMHHLQPAAEAFHAAADDPLRAHRQREGEVVLSGVEEDEFDRGGIVGAAHTVGLARIAPRNVVEHVQCERRDAALVRLDQPGPPGAVDQAHGQMKQKVDNASSGQLADELRKLRSDARQGARLGEQREENCRPHRLAG